MTLLLDNRISEPARIIGYWIALQEPDKDGWVEVPFDDLRRILHGYPSDDVICRHLRMLRGAGWAERKSGGRGHSDSYRLLRPEHERAYTEDRSADSGGVSLDPQNLLGYFHDKPGQERVYPHVVVVGEGVVVGGGDAREGDLCQMDPKAVEGIEGNEKLAGCRKPLLDYMARRVKTDRQWGYLHSLLMWIDDGPGGPRGFAELKPAEKTHLLATCLNDLLTEDELQMKSSRGQVGIASTLRTKIEVTIRRGNDDGRSWNRGATTAEAVPAVGASRGAGTRHDRHIR